ncbi:unnamed protein product [Triticum turgidum subsp. durum]|uniref:Uncharacterized protein n=1 Tax=Triticum turgidum subsp. durum TaxID=4567 RepID=A0A9R0WM44_TRITD|nr:unnamed protein product [Triticum turgidum subsp. durum]
MITRFCFAARFPPPGVLPHVVPRRPTRPHAPPPLDPSPCCCGRGSRARKPGGSDGHWPPHIEVEGHDRFVTVVMRSALGVAASLADVAPGSTRAGASCAARSHMSNALISRRSVRNRPRAWRRRCGRRLQVVGWAMIIAPTQSLESTITTLHACQWRRSRLHQL